MRFLILSCNTGEGHNSAAKALCEYFEKHNIVCEVKDSLSFWSKETSKIISNGHSFVYKRLPKLFGATYRFEENHPPKDGDDSIIYDIVTNGYKKLCNYLNEEKFDKVICVHIFAAMMVTKLRRSGKLNIPFYFVATDYTCSPGVNELDCDLFFIPHNDLRDEFISCGIDKDKIYASGIPISQKFLNDMQKNEAKERLNIPQNEKVVLLACGSMGCGPIKQLVEIIPPMLPQNTRLVVICGRNQRLYSYFYKKGIAENVTVLGYTTDMPVYIDASDIVLTKPGGLSSTEGAVKGKPLIFIDAVPGCETKNLDFFVSRGFAETAKTAEGLAELVCKNIKDDGKTAEISERLRKNFSENSAKKIYEKVTENRI